MNESNVDTVATNITVRTRVLSGEALLRVVRRSLSIEAVRAPEIYTLERL